MKVTTRRIVIFAIVAGGLLILLSFLPGRKAVQETPPSSTQTNVMTDEKTRSVSAQSAKATGQEYAVFPSEPERVSQAAKDMQTSAPKAGYCRIGVKPQKLHIELEEGARAQAVAEIMNQGEALCALTLYKSDEEAGLGPERELAKLVEYKRNVLLGEGKPAAKALRFSGVPWINGYPPYFTLASGVAQKVEVTVDGRGLKEGFYLIYLFAVGKEERESLSIPVEVVVKPAPRIRLIKLSLDDGFSAETSGNKNRVGNPGERIGIAVTLKNEGNAGAEDVALVLRPDDPAAATALYERAESASVQPQEEFTVSFIVDIAPGAHPQIPPSATLSLSDKYGRRWSENFYLGETGNFPYPTGLVAGKEQEKLLEQIQQKEPHR